MADMKKVFDLIKERDVKYVDFRFTDPRGKWQHTAQPVHTIDESIFTDGVMFDGSSIAGWKDISASDMTLMPDSEFGLHRPVRLADPAHPVLRRDRAHHRPAL